MSSENTSPSRSRSALGGNGEVPPSSADSNNIQRVVPTLRVSPTPVGANGKHVEGSENGKSVSPDASEAAGSSSTPLPRSVNPQDDETKRYCWVCFATDEDDLLAQWVKPCRCRGTTKWVHQACIQRWIDEKQKGNTAAKVTCPQCSTEYVIFYPRVGTLVVILDSLDALVSRVCPFVAAGIVVGSIYWTAVTYGAVTVMQVAGHKEGLSVMEQADPLVLLVGLPTIPVMLILGKMVRWEDHVLRFMRKHSWKIPLFKHVLPSLRQSSLMDRVSQEIPALSDPISATRILCGALLLPTISTILGKFMFENVRSNFRRALLGGFAFIAIKGLLRIYHKQKQYVRQSERKIIDFVEPVVASPSRPSGGDPSPVTLRGDVLNFVAGSGDVGDV